jgi:hypothetical protein
MTNYYKSNAIYDELERRGAAVPFVWVSGNAWILIYADNTAAVQVVAFVSGKSTMLANAAITLRLGAAKAAAMTLAASAGATFAEIQFNDEEISIDSVLLNKTQITLGELKNWFERAGLDVRGTVTSKAINDASSSAYQNWQRENLGAIKVSDVDLIRLNPKTGGAVEIIELKRSYFSIEKWRPFEVDFANFNVLSNLAARIGAKFTIAYNVRSKSPYFHDDATLISLFSYSRDEGARARGVVSFEQFLSGQ